MTDFDFRFGPLWGFFSIMPETNGLGFYIDRRGRDFSINIGFIIVSIMVCFDLETPVERKNRKLRVASFKAAK